MSATGSTINAASGVAHASGGRRALTLEEKRFLYREGYVIVRGAVAPELVEVAQARIRAARKGESLAGDAAMTDLVNRSSITPILHEVLGQFDPPTQCQVAITKRSEPSDRFTPPGYRDRDVPYYGAALHMDGSITIAPPQVPMEGTPDEIYHRYFAAGPRGDLGRSAAVMGHNFTPMVQDPERTLGLGSFTAFVFVSLSDQSRDGCGQTALVPRSHHAVERFFQWQRSQGDRLGPEGPGWPRLNHDVPNRCGLLYMPDAVREELSDDTCETTPDGKRWPRPIYAKLMPGDACIATWHILHSATRNETGSESRKNIIFRIRNKSRQPDKVLTGGSDHPDRGWLGEFLDYEPGNDPWLRSKDAMCDMWAEWEGMREVVQELRAGG
jgi:hypothetical protein